MTRGPGAPHHDVAHLAVRYRPSADLLMAQVADRAEDIPDAAVQRDTPDADTTIEWVRRPDGTRQLVGLQVVFAATRAAEGRLSGALPADLDARLRPVVRSLAGFPGDLVDGSDTPPASDPLARNDLALEVPTDELVLPTDLGDSTTLLDLDAVMSNDLVDAMRIDLNDPGPPRSPASLAEALDALADGITAIPDADALPTRRLTRILHELADAIVSTGGLPAPGVSAAARAAVRGGTPLTAGERTTLADLLRQLDDPGQWDDAEEGIRALTARLTDGGQP
jgi:hypothetical protein